MKLSKKAKSIFTIMGTLTATSVMIVPALTLTSCSSASNSYYPNTKINFINANQQQILGLEIPNNLILNNGTNQISWDNTYYGFSNLDEVNNMYKKVLVDNGLNIYQPSKNAVDKYNRENKTNWYKDNGCQPLPNNFALVNRLPLAAVNALNIFQFSQLIAINYAKFWQKSLINLGVECFNENNPFSILKNFSFNKKEFKQLMYGLTIGIGQAGNSYFLGISDLGLKIDSSVSLDPNNPSSLINPGTLIGTPGQYIKSVPNSNPLKYEINYDKLNNDTTHFISVTPTIKYSWYKQLQTGGEPIDTTNEFDELKEIIKNLPKDDVYNQLGALKQNFSLELKPITFAIQQEVLFKDLDLNKDGTTIFTNKSQAITTGGVFPISLINNKKINLNFGLFDNNPPTSILDYAINAASFQLLIQAVSGLQINGNDNNIDWTNNLYKLPYFGFEQFNNLIQSENNLWSKTSIKSNDVFIQRFQNVEKWFNQQIGDDGSQWISLTTVPSKGHLEKLLKKFN